MIGIRLPAHGSRCFVGPAFAALAMLGISLAPQGASARDSLGVFGSWAAFRDPGVPRCYAIAEPDHVSIGGGAFEPYADVASWPKRGVRGELHFRLARRLAPNSPITLSLAGQHFELVGGGSDAWSVDQRMDAAIVAAMRSAPGMTLTARDTAGKVFIASWKLAGAATAMDSALLGCAALR